MLLCIWLQLTNSSWTAWSWK